MAHHILSRPRQPLLELHPDIHLPLARTHEACGAARISFALWVAGRTRGPVLWIAPAWAAEGLNPDGMQGWADPGRFLFVDAPRSEDLLWCMEEALRSGTVPLVVADLPEPPPLTPVRRLHLAAETGARLGRAPLGLLLTPGDGGAQGVESRWHMAPDHTARTHHWHLERRRARTQPQKAWEVTQTAPHQPLQLSPRGQAGAG